jgi:SAM-dependent methyltransferase
MEQTGHAQADHAMSWISAIARTDRGGALEALPGVSAFVHSEPWVRFDNPPLDRALEDYVVRDPLPLPCIADREGYHGERHYDYWLSGLKDYLHIRHIIREYGLPSALNHRVLDFGCSSGRVLRHFLCNEPGLELWGVDLDARAIAWIQRYLGPRPLVLNCTTLPSLPLEDDAFGALYGLSVFTHIDELELAWLCELRRILQPGGIAYLTVHTEHTWQLLSEHHVTLYHDLLQHPSAGITPASFQAPMPDERLVLKWPGSVNNSTVFVSTDYVTRIWGRFFEVLAIVREGSHYQDVVVLRKPSAAAKQGHW